MSKCVNKNSILRIIYSYICLVTCLIVYLIVLHSTRFKPLFIISIDDTPWTISHPIFLLSIILEIFEFIYNGACGFIHDIYSSTILLLLKSNIVFIILNFNRFNLNHVYVLVFISSDTFIKLARHLNVILQFHKKHSPFVEYLDETGGFNSNIFIIINLVSFYSFSISTIFQLILVIQVLPEVKNNDIFRHFPYPMPNKFNFFVDLYFTLILLIGTSFVSSMGLFYKRLICK